jgi:hypothetical protein
MMQYMRARLIYRRDETRPDGVRVSMVIWQLPQAAPERPYALKYRLYAGYKGKTLVRYDNEEGKGDHRHLGASERDVPYMFVSAEQLVIDFLADIEEQING